jgi:zinc D-Ala-D-Ala carboxypeptidase
MKMSYKYFKKEEFTCPCCGVNKIKDELIEKLDKAREIARVPFVITSGFRCPKHNKEIGGSPTSSHLKGLAADIKTTNSKERFKILDSLLKVGFKRVGIGEEFIHADIDEDKTQMLVWDYYKKH